MVNYCFTFLQVYFAGYKSICVYTICITFFSMVMLVHIRLLIVFLWRSSLAWSFDRLLYKRHATFRAFARLALLHFRMHSTSVNHFGVSCLWPGPCGCRCTGRLFWFFFLNWLCHFRLFLLLFGSRLRCR